MGLAASLIAFEMLQELAKVFGKEHFYSREVIQAVNDETITKTITGEVRKREYNHPDLRSAVAVVATKDKEIDSKKLGSWLRNWKGRPAGGFCLLQAGGSKPKKWNKVVYFGKYLCYRAVEFKKRPVKRIPLCREVFMAGNPTVVEIFTFYISPKCLPRIIWNSRHPHGTGDCFGESCSNVKFMMGYFCQSV